MLEVINKNEILVVDSRLVAEELGIQHKSFKETIRENLEDIEAEYGKLTFETAPSNTSNQTETYYLLTEDQAIYLMTLSQKM